ncbi:BZ3500_MvSof-1268-A1-R1_Chr2-2g04782 [Microbotryum saponariae]|uniref:BZ3500_MvSof-1268-A1-R1_Chr2-2g04782 protein n=1 Tax=Microbotryum saponariae TaxID=289078 RepID=A0A2X0KA42_9BASI|nr:BZ3500_MvSof-1268-A1-R1_Chr2-2g04782 [Microbotryum saponariae]SDA00154.1 BZ3501_MvSof-1269-A2-R1_Chr2-2g04456 [Microbotryum saponariae]
MAGRIPVGKAILMTGLVTALGYGIMAATTPTDEQFYNSLSPDLKKKVDDARRKGGVAQANEEHLKSIQASAQDDKPVWATTDVKTKR